HLAIVLVIHEMNAMIPLRKTAGLVGNAVLPDANSQLTRQSDVERRSRVVTDDVNPIIVIGVTHRGRIKRSFDFAQDDSKVVSANKRAKNKSSSGVMDRNPIMKRSYRIADRGLRG